MKETSNSYAAIFTFIFGVILTVSWLSCQTSFSQRIADDKVAEQSNAEITSTPKATKSQSDETDCLSAEYPQSKSKYIVSFGVINSKSVDIPKPEYPKAAIFTKISGDVIVKVLVDEKGEVAWGRIESGNPLLQMAVRKVVCQARFKPQRISGRTTSVNGIIIYRFMPR